MKDWTKWNRKMGGKSCFITSGAFGHGLLYLWIFWGGRRSLRTSPRGSASPGWRWAARSSSGPSRSSPTTLLQANRGRMKGLWVPNKSKLCFQLLPTHSCTILPISPQKQTFFDILPSLANFVILLDWLKGFSCLHHSFTCDSRWVMTEPLFFMSRAPSSLSSW